MAESSRGSHNDHAGESRFFQLWKKDMHRKTLYVMIIDYAVLNSDWVTKLPSGDHLAPFGRAEINSGEKIFFMP